MMSIFHELIYQPLYNIVIFFYNIIPLHDFGIAIIVVTILIKLVLIPVSRKQIESQKQMQDLQPKIKKIQEKYKDDKEKQTKAVMEFYKTNKINPFSGCLPLVFQLIFLIAFYRIIINISAAGLVISGDELYSFIKNPVEIKHLFIGIIDLSKPNIYLAFLAAVSQYWQTKMMMEGKKGEVAVSKDGKGSADFAQIMSKQMLYLGPVLTFIIGIKFAAGLALYWLASTLFSAIQQIYIFKGKKD
ncbi:YidC/Oxa1 family membrane protein insertase [Patescibacteria group bacterium]